MCLCLKAIIKVNQPSLSSSIAAAAAGAGAGAGAVAVAVVIFFCTVCPFTASSCKRQKANQCVSNPYLCTCTCIYSEQNTSGN